MTTRADQELDAIVDNVTAGIADDSEAMAAFFEAIRPLLKSPTLGLNLGHRVQLEEVAFETIRRGIVAVVRVDGRLRQVALLDVAIPGKSKLAKHIRAYQRWAGVDHEPKKAGTKAEVSGEDVIEAAVLKVGMTSARLRPLGSTDEVTFKGTIVKLIPGQVATVQVKKRWNHRRFAYMSGAVEAIRIDVPALDLRPLGVRELGRDDPSRGEPYDDRLIALWEQVTAEPKPVYEMEKVIPGFDPSDWDNNPLLEALKLRRDGDGDDAEEALMGLLHADLRCLDAHAYLGEWAMESATHAIWIEKALAHFDVGVRIGEQALGDDFGGMLPWGLSDNRPFLRCLHGYGVALWRLGHRDEALGLFERICRLNPVDNTGARHCWLAVRNGESWNESM